MDKQERLEKLKEAQEKISNEIEELTNEIENEKPKYWKPVNGDKIYYWYAGEDCAVEERFDKNKSFHINKYAEGELFPTEELCVEHHKEKIYKERWKRLSIESGEYKNPWDGIHDHWIVYYSINTGKLSVACEVTTREGVYFSSCVAAENAINEIGEYNVKRYILGIKE